METLILTVIGLSALLYLALSARRIYRDVVSSKSGCSSCGCGTIKGKPSHLR